MAAAEIANIKDVLRLGDVLAKNAQMFESLMSQTVPLLKAIEKNTKTASSPQASSRKKTTTQRSASKVGPPPQPQTVSAPLRRKTPKISPKVVDTISDVTSGKQKSLKTLQNAKIGTAEGKDARKPATPAQPDQNAENQPQAETASQKAIADTKERKNKEKKDKKFLDSLKDTVEDGGGGGAVSQSGKAEDLKDAAGSATGGVFWGAAMEMKEAAEGMGGDDDKSLSGSLTKFLKDKTGITKVQETIGAAKQKAVEKMQSLAGKEELPEDDKQDKSDRVRDEKGHFVAKDKSAQQDVPPEDSGEQVEKLDAITDVLQLSEKKDQKRHGEIVKAFAGGAAGGAAGGGLLGALGGLGGKSRRRGRRGKLGKLGKMGKLGGIAAALGGGGGLLSLFGGDSEETPTSMVKDMAVDKASEKAASKAVTPKAGKAAGKGASKFAGKGASKALGMGAKGLRALGPMAAIATMGYDAYQGWNDQEMQSKAFGLEKGQKATTGQKAASSAANVLDMGGLISGGLSMLGVETSTADLAKGIHSFFGGEDEAESAKMSINKPDKVESAKEVVEKSQSLAQAETQKESGNLSKQLEKLANSIKQDKPKKDDATASLSLIATEFNDATLVLMAHDRI